MGNFLGVLNFADGHIALYMLDSHPLLILEVVSLLMIISFAVWIFTDVIPFVKFWFYLLYWNRFRKPLCETLKYPFWASPSRGSRKKYVMGRVLVGWMVGKE